MKLDLVEGSDSARIFQFFEIVDKEFSPPLSERVNLTVYANKLAAEAVNLFVVEGNRDIAHAAFYCNDIKFNVAYISSIAVLPNFHGSGVAGNLLDEIFERCLSKGMALLRLEVDVENLRAVKFYEKYGFQIVSDNVMQREIDGN
ncbi:MAG: GNAT family N-acetyltransferase [Pseudomonadota bacterium]|nr:GNAT family N-acetyltransferase [Pseudomonadota bacterium]